MRTFDYERPDMLADALALMADADGAARPLAGGTDLIIRIRDGSIVWWCEYFDPQEVLAVRR